MEVNNTSKFFNLRKLTLKYFFQKGIIIYLIFKKDFERLYPEMMQKIEECDFCSIDCELSGVTQYKDLNSFDTPKNRYDKMKKVEIIKLYNLH